MRVVILVLAACVVFAIPLHAEDEPAHPIPHGDFLEALRALDDGVGHFSPPPVDPGLYDKHRETWKRYAKPRARRMRSRIEQLRKGKLWGVPQGEDGPAVALAEDSWSALAKGLTSLYAELGTMRSRYGEQRVNERTARKAWLRRHPRPDPIERVPSRDALEELDRTILDYRLAGEVVPYRLISARNRVAAQVHREEEAARARKRAEYEKRKRAAFAAIDARVAETNGALRSDVDRLAAQQRAIREIVAAAQAIEEARLKALVAETPKVGAHLAKAEAWFAEMAAGRTKALAFDDKRSSRWGSLVRQGWMTHRTKLLAAIGKAREADAEAQVPKSGD